MSILGTSGIVRPMSEAALIDSLRLELDMQAAAGAGDIVVTPGNYGEHFSREVLHLSLDHWATCSNYIGRPLITQQGWDFAAFCWWAIWASCARLRRET
ncbi:MAG: cobalt-precorrin-5B (C(1))-methyltransferase [Intestinimonas sp.]